MTATRGRASGSSRDTLETSGISEVKLRPPAQRRGRVERARLIERLKAAEDVSVVSIVAPAGYGKTLLLAEWVETETRPTAWLSLDRSDDDPATLLFNIAKALRQAGLLRLDGDAHNLRFTSDSALSHGVPRLIQAIDPAAGPGILVLDSLQVLRKRDSNDVIGVLVHQLEEKVQVAIASRTDGQLPIPTLRAKGTVLELTAADLAFDEGEAAQLLDTLGTSDFDLADLMAKTEGWPVGVYLSGVAGQVGSLGAGAMAVGGDDLYIAEYLRHEILDHLSEARVSFLTRTSILDQLSGSLCDAVLETTGSGRTLEALEHSNLFIMRLDRIGEWHRYHHMFQDLLKIELRLREPEIMSGLHARAAEWFEANGMPETAIRHAQSAGDSERVSRLIESNGRLTYAMGRSDTLLDWLDWLDRRGDITIRPEIAALGAMTSVLLGDPVGVERWSIGEEPLHPLARLTRALQTPSGTSVMIGEARMARAALPPASEWIPAALGIEGLATLWEGDVQQADALFSEAISWSEPLNATVTAVVALTERALIATTAGDWSMASELSSAALRMVRDSGMEGYATSALCFVVSARLARGRNDIPKARELLAQAARLRPRVNSTIPGLSVQTYLEMAKTYLELSDTAGARQVIRAAEDILHKRPDLGSLPQQLAEIKQGLTPAPGKVGPSALTTAELRVLPLLATHLTFPEIGERLYVSRHTVKTQAMSIYRKLGASSRSEAVQEARGVGLLGV